MKKYIVSNYERRGLSDKAMSVGYILLLMAGVGLFLTLIFPLGNKSDAALIYLRNFSSVAALAYLGYYLREWSFIYYSNKVTPKDMRLYKFLTLIAVIVCALKVLIAVVMVFNYVVDENLIWLYYIGEGIAWIALGVFFLSYYLSLTLSKQFREEEFQDDTVVNEIIPEEGFNFEDQ